MNKLLRSPKFLIIFVVILLVITALVLMSNRGKDSANDVLTGEETANSTSDPTDEITDTSNPVEAQANTDPVVNPEEQYLVAKKAGLPYETDQLAITFRADGNEPTGITLLVIDKTQPYDAGISVKDEANRYLTAKGVDLGSVKIKYLGLDDER